MSAPAGATHWVSGGVRFDDSAPFEAVLTSDALRHTTGLGWVDTFEVVAIERTVDDEGRVSPTGAAIVYLRKVAR